MLAVDTNIVVRYLTGDHPGESLRAKRLIERERVFVPVTVLLETEWVLRSAYGFAPARLAVALRAFGGLPNVTIDDAGPVAQAIDWMEAGMDFADALHLSRSPACEAFASFDKRLARLAERAGALRVRAP